MAWVEVPPEHHPLFLAALPDDPPLEGAEPFDPMGNGRRGDEVMLPEALMDDAPELRRWIGRAFEAVAKLPPEDEKARGGER